MKPIPALYLAACLAVTIPAGADGAPVDSALPRAEVTLPFADIRALLEAAHPATPAPVPPVAFTIARGRVAVDYAKAVAVATFEVEVLAEGWQLIPLIATPFTLDTVTPAGVTVVVHDGMLCLISPRPGRFNVALSFRIPAALIRPDGPSSNLRFAPVAAGSLEITAPRDTRVVLAGNPQSVGDGPLPLPATGGEFTLSLRADRPAKPTTWAVSRDTFVRQAEDRAICESRLRLIGESGSGLSARISLPREATRVEITGPDQLPRRCRPGSADLTWETPDVLARDLTIRYELPAPVLGEPWVITPPTLDGSTPTAARTFVLPLPGCDFKTPPGAKSPVDPPSWIARNLGVGQPFASNAPGPFTVELRALPRLEADTARITTARFATRLVPDGARLCEARIAFNHRGPLRWRFSLPPDSELLSCEVNGDATNPLLLGEGQLALLIPATPGEDRTSQVAFSYTERTAAFAPVEGRLAVSLPATPLFIEELAWSIALPDAFEATAFEGNVEPGPVNGSEITFRKRLVRNEAAHLEIYYRKRSTTP